MLNLIRIECKAKVFALLYGSGCKAHPDGVVCYKNGAFMRVDEISEPLLRGLEKALSLSRSYFLKLMDMNVKHDWDDVFDTLSWFHATTESHRRLWTLHPGLPAHFASIHSGKQHMA